MCQFVAFHRCLGDAPLKGRSLWSPSIQIAKSSDDLRPRASECFCGDLRAPFRIASVQRLMPAGCSRCPRGSAETASRPDSTLSWRPSLSACSGRSRKVAQLRSSDLQAPSYFVWDRCGESCRDGRTSKLLHVSYFRTIAPTSSKETGEVKNLSATSCSPSCAQLHVKSIAHV